MSRKQNEAIELTVQQEQILYGTLMGDAYIRHPHQSWKNGTSSLHFEHGHQQYHYALWKAEILGMNTFIRDRADINPGKVYHVVSAYSQCSPTYSDLYRRIYGDGGTKKLDQTVLYNLGSLGLAVWYMDDGALNNGRTVIIHTERYSYREHILMQRYFTETWGITPKIQKKRTEGGEKHILVFSAQDSYKFLEIVRPHIQPELMYKVTMRPYSRAPKWYKDMLSQKEDVVNG